MPIIIDNLSFTYNPKAPFKTDALKNITMRIEDGDFFGIIGHTGSGKSTLISHLNGLTKLTGGSIKVSAEGTTEIDLTKKYNYKELRSRVGMVFQYPEYQLFDETVEKDVGFGPRNLGLKPDEIKTRVKEAIELVGLNYDEIAQRSPFEISGGQMRRVALAGVLAMKPKILILDEPTAGLDPSGKKQILKLINSIRNECPTIIMISHNMDEIFANCNRIAVLAKGELKGIFTPAELYQNSNLVEENGLEMPAIFKIAQQLNQRGYDIKNIMSEDDLIRQIAAQRSGKNSDNSQSENRLDLTQSKRGDGNA